MVGVKSYISVVHMVVVEIPKPLATRAIERGIDIERFVIDSLLNMLNLDPKEEAKIHIDLAKKFFREGKNLLHVDPIQASEKLYKAVEEAIKALTILDNIEEILERVKKRGRWTVTDLDKAARKLSDKKGDFILHALDEAWVLHVWGFHEAKLDSEAIIARLPPIEKLVGILDEYCRD